ncbi:MAG: hypothetical protein BWY95_02465 [Bacteroidetes bacterium ADurb.BinA104]|nr:MAG: hypothetical protein BWY95_02465 [Bacteroidetes bacterium ADurb.BinA104]
MARNTLRSFRNNSRLMQTLPVLPLWISASRILCLPFQISIIQTMLMIHMVLIFQFQKLTARSSPFTMAMVAESTGLRLPSLQTRQSRVKKSLSRPTSTELMNIGTGTNQPTPIQILVHRYQTPLMRTTSSLVRNGRHSRSSALIR